MPLNREGRGHLCEQVMVMEAALTQWTKPTLGSRSIRSGQEELRSRAHSPHPHCRGLQPRAPVTHCLWSPADHMPEQPQAPGSSVRGQQDTMPSDALHSLPQPQWAWALSPTVMTCVLSSFPVLSHFSGEVLFPGILSR